jgi:tetratricopeptide (TPR) repeat protein
MLEADLVRLHPTVTEYQYGWAMALHDHGHMVADTNLAEAVTMCTQAAAILEKIQAGPKKQSVPRYEHGLAEIDHNLAKLLLQTAAKAKDPDQVRTLRAAARKCYDKALDLHGSLLSRFQMVPRYCREQARHYHSRGLLLAGALNRRPEGLADLTQAMKLYGWMHDFPSAYIHQLDLGMVKSDLGQLLLKTPGDTKQALTLLDQATAHLRGALKIEPKRDTTRQRLIRTHRTLARTWLKQRQAPEAAAAATNLAEVAANSPADLYEAARLLTACSALANNSPSAEGWAQHAVSVLDKIVRQRYKTPGQLVNDPALVQLRPRADFQRLVATGRH